MDMIICPKLLLNCHKCRSFELFLILLLLSWQRLARLSILSLWSAFWTFHFALLRSPSASPAQLLLPVQKTLFLCFNLSGQQFRIALKRMFYRFRGKTIAPKARRSKNYVETIIIGHDFIIESHKFPFDRRGAVCISYIYIFLLCIFLWFFCNSQVGNLPFSRISFYNFMA